MWHQFGVLLHSNAKPAKDHYRLESTGHPTLYPFKEKGQPHRHAPSHTYTYIYNLIPCVISPRQACPLNRQPTLVDITFSILNHRTVSETLPALLSQRGKKKKKPGWKFVIMLAGNTRLNNCTPCSWRAITFWSSYWSTKNICLHANNMWLKHTPKQMPCKLYFQYLYQTRSVLQPHEYPGDDLLRNRKS